MINPSDQTSGLNKSSPIATVNCAQTSIHFLNEHAILALSVCCLCVALFEQPPIPCLSSFKAWSDLLKEASLRMVQILSYLAQCTSHTPHQTPHVSFQTSTHHSLTHLHPPSPKYMINHVRLCVQIHHHC